MSDYFKKIDKYKHLAINLVQSDLRSRFRRSRLGVLWTIIQPLCYSLIIAWAWGTLFNAADYWDFAIYLYSGLIIWENFSNVTLLSLSTLIGAKGYIKQAPIPFVVFQARVPLTSLVVSGFALLGLWVLQISLGKLPEFGFHLLLLPVFAIIFIAFTIPLGIIMSYLGAQFRDAQHILGLVVQALFFLSPVILTREVLNKPDLEILNYINPMMPLINMFRNIVVYSEPWKVRDTLVILAWCVLLWLIAYVISKYYGRRVIHFL